MPNRKSSLERARMQEVNLEILPVNPFQSFRCFRHDYPALGARYCVHEEYEIHLIRKGSGHYKIGGNLGRFKAGQVSLVGSRVPHDWVSDLRKDQVLRDRDVVIQFSRNWMEMARKSIPEFIDLEHLLDQAQRAIIFEGSGSENLKEILDTICDFSGIEQVLKMLEVLLIMSRVPESERVYVLEEPSLNSAGYLARLTAEKGTTYILNNLDKKIRLRDAAKLSFMSESQFSRAFKNASGISFGVMIRRLRIEHGCKLLSSTDLSIASVAKKSGFTNLSNFNRQFLREMGLVPREFRALVRNRQMKLLESVFGDMNQLLQQAKINAYVEINSSRFSEFKTQLS